MLAFLFVRPTRHTDGPRTLLIQVSLKVPVVVRLEGTNVDQGKRILKVSVVSCITFSQFAYSWSKTRRRERDFVLIHRIAE